MGTLIALYGHALGWANWLVIAQTQVADGAAEAVQDVVADKPAPGFLDNMGFMFPAFMAVMLLYLILMAKPQDKNKTKPSELLAKLKKNDRVVTAGGIIGTVVNVKQDAEQVTLRIDESTNARMQVMASSIVRVLDDDAQDKD